MRPSPPIGEGDVPRALDATSSAGAATRQVQFQLTETADVKAAHAYFQPTGAESAHLPAMEAAHLQGLTPGSESLAMHLASKAGEGAAMGAGAQAISPLIQMIMRMPGHLGLMSSFFEFLGNFFMGQHILGALDPTQLLAQHAEAAMSSLSHMTGQIGSHLGGVGVHLLPHDALLHGVTHAANAAHGSLLHGLHGAQDMATHVEGAKDLAGVDVPGKEALNNTNYADYKLSSVDRSSNFNSSVNDGGLQPTTAGTDPQYVAWDSSSTFRPSLTGAQQAPMSATNAAVDPNYALNNQVQQPTTTSTSTASSPTTTSDMARSTGAGSERGSLLGGRGHSSGAEQTAATSDASTTGDGATAGSDTQPAPIDYTVKHGDNLWDIAHKHFGDGTKWSEIYKMNQNAIGDNPRLIHEGTQLQLPGDGHIASGDYVVKPGDNLWDISQSHLGGGQHRPDLYHNNEGIVGSNPAMIHPGQHLNMSGDNGGQLANADVSSHAHHLSHASADAAHHTVAHAPQHSIHIAHAHTPAAHHIAHADHGQTVAESHPAAHADHAKVASTGGSTPAHSAAATPSGGGAANGQQVALRAQPSSLASVEPGKFSQISGDGQ